MIFFSRNWKPKTEIITVIIFLIENNEFKRMSLQPYAAGR